VALYILFTIKHTMVHFLARNLNSGKGIIMSKIDSFFSAPVVRKARQYASEWVNRRMFKKGRWKRGTLYCLSYGMENCCPIFSDPHNENACRYLVLLEYGCKRLKAAKTIPKDFGVFVSNITEDFESFFTLEESSSVIEFLKDMTQDSTTPGILKLRSVLQSVLQRKLTHSWLIRRTDIVL